MRAGVDKPVFLDRDGVLIADVGPLTAAADIRVLPGVAEALALLHDAGFALVVVSNQTAVARGLASEDDVRALQQEIELRLASAGAPPIDDFLFCPHHPSATDPAYRAACSCRKPEPGLIQLACARHGIDASASVMIGDRPSDVVAGRRAGCRAVWLRTGRHTDRPIETAVPFETPVPHHVCDDLLSAAHWLVAQEAA